MTTAKRIAMIGLCIVCFWCGYQTKKLNYVAHLTLRVEPPPAPFTSIAILMKVPEPGEMELGTKVGRVIFIDSYNGWYIHNIKIDGNKNELSGWCPDKTDWRSINDH